MVYTTNEKEEKTVTCEFARTKGGRSYDWSAKVAFSLSINEIADMCAYLTEPWVDRFILVHGNTGTGTKTLTVKLQTGSVLFALSHNGVNHLVPVQLSSIYLFRNLLMSRLVALQPELPAALHWRSLRHLAQSHLMKSPDSS